MYACMWSIYQLPLHCFQITFRGFKQPNYENKEQQFCNFSVTSDDCHSTDGCTLHCHSVLESWLLPTSRSVTELGHINYKMTEQKHGDGIATVSDQLHCLGNTAARTNTFESWVLSKYIRGRQFTRNAGLPMLPYKLKSLFSIPLAVAVPIMQQDRTGSSNVTGQVNVQKHGGGAQVYFPAFLPHQFEMRGQVRVPVYLPLVHCHQSVQ